MAPETIIVLGGPEASTGTEELLQKEPAVDYVVRGEGEETFCELLRFLLNGEGSPEGILGLAYREGTKVRVNPPRPPIKEWPFPYDREELIAARRRLVYYESLPGMHLQLRLLPHRVGAGPCKAPAGRKGQGGPDPVY